LVIKSCRCEETQQLYHRQPVRKIPPDLQRTALRKLWILDAAGRLEDLPSPPGNRLEALKGDRLGQHSIRINDRFRICFAWQGTDAYDVEIVDYH
jgi:proteic killer suppression protein